MINNDFFQKKRVLETEIRKCSSLALEFSGGVDSTFLLATAKKILGENVFAVIAKTPVFPEQEELEAIEFLKNGKIKFSIITPDLMSVDDFIKNNKDRCYICKKIIFKQIIDEAAKNGFGNIAHGVNTDDFNDYRPGLKAADELGFLSPLVTAGFSKEDIRKGSREMKLSTADKPAMACLASRIPYGDIITEKKLKIIEEAEDIIKALGFKFYRVRHHGDIARIEVAETDFQLIFREDIRQQIILQFKNLGFLYISVDLEGYSQGSMNRSLQELFVCDN